MRLLHTETHQFREFFETATPPYAILSHRWSDSEVSLKEFRKGLVTDGVGYENITNACEFAYRRGRQWIWIDSCCIDKRSSAELSEAINSMYIWYEGAQECYVYLADVRSSRRHSDSLHLEPFQIEDFRRSNWFTRGWTLQELLAPRELFFCNSSWDIIGTRASLMEEIAAITGIHSSYFVSTHFNHSIVSRSPHSASVARKMSWAANRTTTRSEDIAYCLLGLFDVNMPLLYGEGGEKAFVRLQLEIIKKSDDETIFGWFTDKTDSWRGLLAPSPFAFRNSEDLEAGAESADRSKDVPYTMTHRGLYLKRPLQQLKLITPVPGFGPVYYCWKLHCFASENEQDFTMMILLIGRHRNGAFLSFDRTHTYGERRNLQATIEEMEQKEIGYREFYVRQDGL